MRTPVARRIVASIFVLCTVIGLKWAGNLQPTQAQTVLAAARLLPDVEGFHPGMTLQEGYNRMKEYNANAIIKFDNTLISQLGDKPLPYQLTMSESNIEQSPKIVQLRITLPPNEQIIWRVAGQLQTFPGQEDMVRTILIAALREKYGPETYAHVEGSPATVSTFVWLFDEQGRPATENTPPASPCAVANLVANSLGPGMAILNQPSSTFPQDQSGGWMRCKSLVFVNAVLQADAAKGNPESINRIAVSVADSGLASRAQDATVAFLAKANAK